MYNKIFTKILDSSIWLEPVATRIVWVTFIAAMDEDGFVAFAAPANVARRANIGLSDAVKALAVLESPDENSSDSDNDGRRIQRVPGGWIVLNAAKYRDLVTRETAKEMNRKRVAKFRAKQKAGNGGVTECNESVMQSEAYTEAKSVSDTDTSFAEFWAAYPRKVGKGDAEKAWKKHHCAKILPKVLVALKAATDSPDWRKDGGQFIPHPATWLNREGWEDELFPTSKPSGPARVYQAPSSI